MSFLLLSVLLTAEDCADRNVEVKKENKTTEAFFEIENCFAEDKLEKEVLSAFEERGVQKLTDLADYVNIYVNPVMPQQFRKQAAQMIDELFNSKNNVLEFYNTLELKEDTTNNLLYNPELSAPDYYITKVDSLNVTSRFILKTDQVYKGELSFIQDEYQIISGDTLLKNTKLKNMEMVVFKTEKHFGIKSQNVWEVFLGEIK